MSKRFLTITGIAVLLFIIIFGIYEYNKTTISARYGKSYRQNKLLNVIELHEAGIIGERVMIGMLDSGFDLNHPCFKDIQVVDNYDFFNNDSIVGSGGNDEVVAVDHGTGVLSVIAGYDPGQLIGTAFGATYILAKAEVPKRELKTEEEIAVRAIQWLDSLGVDVISSSLKFRKFEDANYFRAEQMDGKTTIITQIADSIVNKGVVFCTCSGNGYEDFDWNIIEPPGDGYNVLSIGALNIYGDVAHFSSGGPTVDGRIKPDLVALGTAVQTASINGFESYSFEFGTSLSAPQIAGIAALILSVHPDLGPEEVEEALKESSENRNNPDIRRGWGVPDALKAVSYFGPAFSNTPSVECLSSKYRISTHILSSNGIKDESVVLRYNFDSEEMIRTKLMEQVRDNIYSVEISIGKHLSELSFYFEAEDLKGKKTRYPHSKYGGQFKIIIGNNYIEPLKFIRRNLEMYSK